MPAKKLPNKNFSWTPELAYAVGLITTDGSLSKDKRHITFTSSDFGLLETFKNCLKLQVRITKNPPSTITKKQCFRIQFSNVQFYNWLTKIGLCTNKTFKLKSLNIPNNVFPDFIRGHLDGDGSIITYIDKYNTDKNPKYIYQRLYVKFSGVSINHLWWLLKTIRRLKNLKGTLNVSLPPKKRENRAPYGEIKFSKKESISLLKWIYYKKDLPCLKRKYKIAKMFLER